MKEKIKKVDSKSYLNYIDYTLIQIHFCGIMLDLTKSFSSAEKKRNYERKGITKEKKKNLKVNSKSYLRTSHR